MTLFDPRQLERMEQDLGTRRSGRSSGPTGPGPGLFWFLVVVVLAAVGGGTWWYAQRGAGSADQSEDGGPAGAGSAAASARRALAERTGGDPGAASAASSKPPGGKNLEQALAEQREEQAKINRLREQEAEERLRRTEGERERRRLAERDRVASWWQANRLAFQQVDTAARQVVDLTGRYVDAQGNIVPAPGRVDLACKSYVAAFDALLAGPARAAPSDELATALQRYLFYHQKGTHLCRTDHYQPAQTQLGSAATASADLRGAIDAALSH